MKTHEEYKSSAPRNRGTETLPPDTSRRKSERPGSGQGSLSRVSIETPATKTGSHYALLPARLFCLPDGAFALLASLVSLHRGERPLTLSAKELAVSQGVTLSTHYDRRHRLMVLGYLDEGGALRPEYRPSEVRQAEGGYCRVDLTAVHGLPPQAVRALAALSDRCNGDKRSRARVPTLARASGRSVRAWHRAFVALVVAGWAWSRGRWRGLGRQQVRADSGKRHNPFRRMSDLICSSRKEQKESDPAVPGGCDTLIQAQQRTARRPTQDELLAMPRAARVAALEACLA